MITVQLSNLRLVALIKKEWQQIKRNRRLVISLLVPPIFQMLLFGFAINPEPHNLRLGITDESHTFASRELIAAFATSQSFQITAQYPTATALTGALLQGDLDAALVIPKNYERLIVRKQRCELQLLLDATNANSAEIAAAYAAAIIDSINDKNRSSTIELRTVLRDNPGLRYSWFVVTGALGILIILNGSIAAAAALVKEKEDGTMAQLLISPLSTFEIIIAKILPIFLLLVAQSWLALAVGCFTFAVPVRGNLILLLILCALCALVSVGLGSTIAAYANTQAQAQLLTIFIIPPIVMFSGSITPLESLPQFLQLSSLLNPARYFAVAARAIMLKGAAITIVYPQLLALLLAALLLLIIGSRRYQQN